MKAENKSGAVQLLDLVWEHRHDATSHSWLKTNHAMYSALMLAIKAGFAFDLEDFSKFGAMYRFGYWAGATGVESFYQTAVLYRNASAYHSIEKYLGRKPFIYPANLHAMTGDGPAGQGLERLVIGAGFRWRGEMATVTSFNDDKQTFTACSYNRISGTSCGSCGKYNEYPKDTLLHRYSISHADLKAAKKQSRVGTQNSAIDNRQPLTPNPEPRGLNG